MKIKSISLENYRGLKAIEVHNLHPRLNLIIGGNGKGKTSFLDAIAATLHQYLVKRGGLKTKSSKKAHFTQTDINNGAKECNINVVVQEGNTNTAPSKINVQLSRGESSPKTTVTPNGLSQFELPEWVIKYYESHRNTVTKPNKPKSNSEVENIFDASFVKYYTFFDFMKWFIDQENYELREKSNLNNLSYQSAALEPLRGALKQFYSGFLENKISNLHVKQKQSISDAGNYTIVVNKAEEEIELQQLSDGEKQLLLTIADLAYRLTILNPNNNEVLSCPGIVLIDEMELHLHPSWQRKIVQSLTKTFPGLQFLITTHSPQIISEQNDCNIYYFTHENELKLLESTFFGADANRVLIEVFKTSERPHEAAKEIDDLNKLFNIKHLRLRQSRSRNRLTSGKE